MGATVVGATVVVDCTVVGTAMDVDWSGAMTASSIEPRGPTCVDAVAPVSTRVPPPEHAAATAATPNMSTRVRCTIESVGVGDPLSVAFGTMYGFMRQPKWMAAHVLVAVLLTSFLAAAMWQYSRHRDRSERNDTVEARVDLEPLVAGDLAQLDPATHEYRTAIARGAWRTAELVTIRNRSQDGASGCHVALPLETETGFGVLAIAGWLPETLCGDELLPNVSIPQSSTVTGRLRTTQTRGRFGPRDPGDGVLASLARTDVARVDQQVEIALADMYLEVVEATPPIDGPVVLDRPATDAGPHFAYAVQWLLFFVVGAVGYPLVIRRQALRGELEDLGDEDADLS